MTVPAAVTKQLTAIPDFRVITNEPLAGYTRFGIGGPAAVLCDASSAEAGQAALRAMEQAGARRIIIGGGTNLVVSDAGFDGIVLRYTSAAIKQEGMSLRVEAGAILQDVVDRSIALGLKGLETMTGIPGYLGGAVYGNAGAYGRSIQELVTAVHATDGECVKTFSNAECQFRYRDSVFKQHKEWLILSAELRFTPGDSVELKKTADGIRTIRDAKYPPTMKCAGSIFKNLIYAELPASVQAQVPPKVVREGKVPSAWFLEQAGAKGLRRGDIQVADYHANLLYNDGAGTAADLVAMIQDLKRRVRERFGFEIEEEVQYV
ncbi:MAG TPA: UDP-N-acetylmuramate dehydrogenase [Bryobacteraceae bacterium]|nr:UDP-N-acetylmuramate dehydrogenase [Bryobacteraceae bacterium]